MTMTFQLCLLLALAASSFAATSSAVNNSEADYSITALPAVKSQPACLFNCLNPIGLADPSGCDDVTNDCACLSAPVDVEAFLTGCVQTVCKSSIDALASAATSLFQSYCTSLYPNSVLASATAANEAADSAAAASTAPVGSTDSTASASSTASVTSSPSAAVHTTVMSGSTMVMTGPMTMSPAATASATGKSGSVQWGPDRYKTAAAFLTSGLFAFIVNQLF